MNNELRNIIIGIIETSTGLYIQTVIHFLSKCKTANGKTEK